MLTTLPTLPVEDMTVFTAFLKIKTALAKNLHLPSPQNVPLTVIHTCHSSVKIDQIKNVSAVDIIYKIVHYVWQQEYKSQTISWVLSFLSKLIFLGIKTLNITLNFCATATSSLCFLTISLFLYTTCISIKKRCQIQGFDTAALTPELVCDTYQMKGEQTHCSAILRCFCKKISLRLSKFTHYKINV